MIPAIQSGVLEEPTAGAINPVDASCSTCFPVRSSFAGLTAGFTAGRQRLGSMTYTR